MSVTAISESRWREAQKCEAEYWARESRDPSKLERDVDEGHHFTKGVLDIRPATAGKSVIDIAGGPYPIGPYALDVRAYTVVDPCAYDDDYAVIDRVRVMAEGYDGRADEVWGYNVLQHVKDPAAVMATARRSALDRIRWFDVVDTPIYPVHPHSISADWLRQEMSKDGFRIVRDIDGSRLVEGARQKWIALVAER